MPIRYLRGLLRDQRGMETLEYALLAGVIALAALLIYLNSGWQGSLQSRLTNSAAATDTAQASPGNGNPGNGNPGNGNPGNGNPGNGNPGNGNPPCGTPPCGNGKESK